MSSVPSDQAGFPFGLLRFLVAVVLFAWLFWIIDLGELWRVLTRTDPALLALLFGLSIIWLLLGALNVWIFLRGNNALAYSTYAQVYVTSWSLSLLIPGQLGDATQIALLRRHGVPAASSAAAYTVDKIISLCLLGVIGTYGLARYLAALPPTVALAISLCAVIAMAGATALVLRVIPVSRLPNRLQEILGSYTGEVAAIAVRHGAICLNIAISLAKWLVTAGIYFTAFAALGVMIGLEPAATIPVVSSLVAYIPVTIAGIGTMEWTAVGLFDSVGIAPVNVVGGYLIIRGTLICCAATILLVGKVAHHAHPH